MDGSSEILSNVARGDISYTYTPVPVFRPTAAAAFSALAFARCLGTFAALLLPPLLIGGRNGGAASTRYRFDFPCDACTAGQLVWVL